MRLLWGSFAHCFPFLTDNDISLDGAVAFCEFLATNKTLRELDISGCTIDMDHALELASAVVQSESLFMLDIDSCALCSVLFNGINVSPTGA